MGHGRIVQHRAKQVEQRGVLVPGNSAQFGSASSVRAPWRRPFSSRHVLGSRRLWRAAERHVHHHLVGSHQQVVTAYLARITAAAASGEGGRTLHTLPTWAGMAWCKSVQCRRDCLSRKSAKAACAELLHEHLPEHFPEPADLVLMS
jgi:hypothetical protein